VRFPFGALLPAIAIVATGVAIWAGRNAAIAVPAGAFAVAAAGLLFAEAWTGRTRPGGSVIGDREEGGGAIRKAFRSGRLGRKRIVETVERLERAVPHPETARRTREEVDRLVALSPAEFREYLRAQLDELEART
jgi:hypothetical protein